MWIRKILGLLVLIWQRSGKQFLTDAILMEFGVPFYIYIFFFKKNALVKRFWEGNRVRFILIGGMSVSLGGWFWYWVFKQRVGGSL